MNTIDLIDTNSQGSFLDGFKNVDPVTWLIIFLTFTLLGFNIFIYLAKGSDFLANILQILINFITPIINNILDTFGYVTKDVVVVAAEGAKHIVTGTANAINTGLTSIEDIGTPSVQPSVQTNVPDIVNTLNNTLNNTKKTHADYEADDSNSKIQTGNNKAGWCYIGEDRGFRTCARVGVNEQCMSGDIFPSNEICINPSLRA